MSDSTARRAPSRPTPCPPPGAALQAAPSWRLPRSPWSNEPDDICRESLATSDGTCGALRSPTTKATTWRVWRPQRNPNESVFWLSSAHMTRVHPTPAPGLRLPQASRRGRATELLFFYPVRDGVARDAEGARQSAQTAPLVVSAQDRFALLFHVSIRARVLAATLGTVAAHVTLPTIGSQPVAN